MSEKEISARKAKLNQILKLKINPYPAQTERSFLASDAKKLLGKSISKKVILAGRLTSLRPHGKAVFADLEDQSGKIQLFFKYDQLGKQQFDLLNLLDPGDFIQAQGKIFKTKAGEVTLEVSQYTLLAKALISVPAKWYGLKDIETRFRQRYLDLLLNPGVKENLVIRSKIIQVLRNFMDSHDFLEVETPILQPIAGGAAAKPFITHYNILKDDFYLRIAPELYLKRLIVGGLEKVYEIGPAFRNEGLSHQHNPEFTIFEFYWAYQDYQGLMKFVEKMMAEVSQKIKGSTKIEYQGHKINLKPPYRKITFTQLVKEKTGLDILQLKTFSQLKQAIIDKKIKLENMAKIKVWVELVDELYKKVARPSIVEPTFITHHPIDLCPLAKADPKNPSFAQRFQLVLAGGTELVNAYSELNNPVEQQQRFLEQQKLGKAGWEESQPFDQDFLLALNYGLPPTAGFGLGIDRLAMLLTDNYSIKEVIFFPTLKKE